MCSSRARSRPARRPPGQLRRRRDDRGRQRHRHEWWFVGGNDWRCDDHDRYTDDLRIFDLGGYER
jgi:hypothetical protein